MRRPNAPLSHLIESMLPCPSSRTSVNNSAPHHHHPSSSIITLHHRPSLPGHVAALKYVQQTAAAGTAGAGKGKGAGQYSVFNLGTGVGYR